MHVQVFNIMAVLFNKFCQKTTQIYESAKNKINSTKWSKATTWNGKYRGMWKCNLFVYDILQEVGATTPKKWYSLSLFLVLVLSLSLTLSFSLYLFTNIQCTNLHVLNACKHYTI